jgi:hypothetical protein
MSAFEDFIPRGKRWASDNKILIGQAIGINIVRRINCSSAYTPGFNKPLLFTSDPRSFKINENDALLFNGMVGGFIAANEHILVAFTNGIECLFDLDDVVVDSNICRLTHEADLPALTFNSSLKNQTNEQKYPGEAAFYDAAIIAMIRDGASDASIMHNRAVAHISNRRKIFNEHF